MRYCYVHLTQNSHSLCFIPPLFPPNPAKFKSLQQRNTGKHRLGSRGYLGKRPIWDKEDVEHEAAGLPDPFAKFTNPLERDFIRARYKWDK